MVFTSQHTSSYWIIKCSFKFATKRLPSTLVVMIEVQSGVVISLALIIHSSKVDIDHPQTFLHTSSTRIFTDVQKRGIERINNKPRVETDLFLYSRPLTISSATLILARAPSGGSQRGPARRKSSQGVPRCHPKGNSSSLSSSRYLEEEEIRSKPPVVYL